MTGRKEEFRALIAKQLEALHRRITELEKLKPRPHEHEISWDTHVGECRRKHLKTVARLRELDTHGDDSWHDVGADVREALAELERTVQKQERRSSSK